MKVGGGGGGGGGLFFSTDPKCLCIWVPKTYSLYLLYLKQLQECLIKIIIVLILNQNILTFYI